VFAAGVVGWLSRFLRDDELGAFVPHVLIALDAEVPRIKRKTQATLEPARVF
jgi:hypothetical protein